MAKKIPSTKFPTAKRKIPSRKFPKSNQKIPSRPFATGTVKIPSRQLATAPAATSKPHGALARTDLRSNNGLPEDDPAALKRELMSLMSASDLAAPRSNSESLAPLDEAFGSSSSNLFTGIPGRLSHELCTTLSESASLRIERIVSHGHASPAGFWYDQDQHEWVALLQGAARLQFEQQTVELQPGDYVSIPAHKKHRVAWTTPDKPTIWLAVYYQ